jgi:hypothetical protein
MFGKMGSTKPVAVFDISSSSVGGAHVLLSHDKEPIVLVQSRADAPLQDDIDMKRFVGETVRHLEMVITEIRKADIHQPEYVQLVLASPWYLSQTRTIVYKKTTPFICTEKLIDGLIQKEIEYMMESDMGRFGGFGKEAILVEKQLSLVKLNGYSTNKPYGKHAETIEIFLTITVAPKIIVDFFSDVIRRNYGARTVGVTTSPYATFVVARDYFDAQHESMIIDVGEEITDVAFIKDSLFLYQHSFPMGTYELYRTIAAGGGQSSIEAKTLLETYRLGKLSAKARQGVESALVLYKKEWQKSLEGILDAGHYGFCLPEQCFITADARFELIFTDIINTDPFIQHTCSRGIVRPIFLNQENIGVLVRHTGTDVLDIPISTAALFVERLLYYNRK